MTLTCIARLHGALGVVEARHRGGNEVGSACHTCNAPIRPQHMLDAADVPKRFLGAFAFRLPVAAEDHQGGRGDVGFRGLRNLVCGRS